MRTSYKVLLVIQLFLVSFLSSYSQGKYQYVVKFIDKDNSPFTIDNPSEYLSQRAIERRQKQGIEIDESDLPISPVYFKSVTDIKSFDIVSSSKWFNDVVVETNDSAAIEKLLNEDFVESITMIPGEINKAGGSVNEKLNVEIAPSDFNDFKGEYGASWRQLSMLNADYLHLKGYQGEGMRIAVLDAGYSFTWLSKHFEHLHRDGKIIDAYNFIHKNDLIYEGSYHGTYVLSTMASYTPDSIIGTAPNAEYVLLRTEDGDGEYVLEEYFWTEAAEFADSAGCDVLNSSLGYTTFDDSLQNHTWQDLDGESTRITLSADRAASKGILVFNSAGNSGDKAWQKIGAPADAFDIISVGAVDSSAALAEFSSRGPTADNRIKPDLLAMGAGAYIGIIDGGVAKSNGTSFASPILAGAAACLWQANPERSMQEIRDAMIQSASYFQNPDTNHGYGIPDLLIADHILKGNLNKQTKFDEILVFPNPFLDEVFFVLNQKRDELLDLIIFDVNGREVHREKRKLYSGKTQYIYLSTEISSLSPGLYIVTLKSDTIDQSIKLIKE